MSVIALSVNGQRLGLINHMYLENTLNISGYRKDGSKRIERYLSANTKQEKTDISTSVLYYVHFRGRDVTQHKERNL